MKQSWFIITILLAISLILVACQDPNDTCAALENPARDECYFNTSNCDKIEIQSLKESCFVEQVKTNGDLSVCEQIENPQSKAYCQVQIILKNNETKGCKTISDPYWKNNCHFQMAQQTTISTECGFIQFGEQRSRCYQELAYAINDYKLCIWTIDPYYQCVTKIAVQTQNESTCNKIFNSDELYRARCFVQVAKAKNDPSICAKASFSKIREECQTFFGSAQTNSSENNETIRIQAK
ncbi:hypothetical protein HYV86_03450 [Candidatus Woesearchaeota archaeon]|nr:hypothetical protein [Candidatus Woesearchaeota archaeon]